MNGSVLRSTDSRAEPGKSRGLSRTPACPVRLSAHLCVLQASAHKVSLTYTKRRPETTARPKMLLSPFQESEEPVIKHRNMASYLKDSFSNNLIVFAL